MLKMSSRLVFVLALTLATSAARPVAAAQDPCPTAECYWSDDCLNWCYDMCWNFLSLDVEKACCCDFFFIPTPCCMCDCAGEEDEFEGACDPGTTLCDVIRDR